MPAEGACPLCGGAFAPHFLSGPFVLRCAGCGLGATRPAPPLAPHPTDFDDTAFLKGYREPVEAEKLAFLKARGLVGRALDVGCAEGTFLARMGGAGVEADPASQERLRAAGIPFWESIDQAEGQYDLVTFWHALEHLPDFLGALRQARELLAEGGHVIAAVPNLGSLQARAFGTDWHGLVLADHLWHFTPATLSAALRKAGFSGIEVAPALRVHALAGWRIGASRRVIAAKGRGSSAAWLAWQAVFRSAPALYLLEEALGRAGAIAAVGRA